MVHLNSNATMPTVHFLALSTYRVRFYGKSAHAAASPWDGKSALSAAQLTFHAIDHLRQRVKPDTRMSYYVVHGGKASNIIPDFVEIQLELRHSNREYLDTVIEKVRNCIKVAAIATETTYFTLHSQEMVVCNSEKAKETIDKGARLIGNTILSLIEKPEIMREMIWQVKMH
ncbi:peptidase dimerization domain-containing protein [Bacillus sp. UNC438CL73TsuS30]|uniref:peptidase dimerization domain-containing protein n=1 Tax=Bacillus sp. UNC438CL73TsuS30 TaxID=1340434 RepID=UPI00047A2980|nr:peptidase dimerization domain-containing protein [Bacillus sp. UNC438CL73TsuS30]